MQDKSLMFHMIRSELEDAVGTENVSTKEVERAVYSVDYFWLSRKWQDAGETGPMPDIIVRPGSTEEVSKVMKIANYYKIPVTTWGGGSGSQGGALPVAGGILLDIKRMDKVIDINVEAGYVTCETGIIFATLEDRVNEKGYSVMHLPSCLTCCTVGGALAHNGIGVTGLIVTVANVDAFGLEGHVLSVLILTDRGVDLGHVGKLRGTGAGVYSGR